MASFTRPTTKSLDHLVRPEQQRLRDLDAERFGGNQIDPQLEFSRLFDGEITRLGAFQNAVELDTHLAKNLGIRRSVTHESALPRGFRPLIDRWEPIPRRMIKDLLPQGMEEGRGKDIEGLHMLSSCCFECVVEIFGTTNLQNLQHHSKPGSHGMQRRQVECTGRRIPQDSDAHGGRGSRIQ